jgi:hypothetical protein
VAFVAARNARGKRAGRYPLDAWLPRLFTPSVVSSQRPFDLMLELRVVPLPVGRICCQASADFIGLAILPGEQFPIEV